MVLLVSLLVFIKTCLLSNFKLLIITEPESSKLITQIEDVEIKIQPTELDELDFNSVKHLNADDSTDDETESKNFF